MRQHTAEQERRAAAVTSERKALADLERRRDKLLAEYERLVDDEDPLARDALEPGQRVDIELAKQRDRITEMKSIVSECDGAADLDAALDFYSGLVASVRGEVELAEGVRQLREALQRVP